MYETSEHVRNSSRCAIASPEPVDERSTLLSNNKQNKTATNQLEKLRHAFPCPSLRSIHYSQGSSPRISRLDQHGVTFLYRRQLKRRGTFHRVITTFFKNRPERDARGTRLPSRSRASSSDSRIGSPAHGSVPSLDVVSPGTILFSGPYLQSAGSHGSTSRPPSLTALSYRTHASHHKRSDSFSVVDMASGEDDLLEPIMDHGVVRSMSNVLLDVRTPIEELGDSSSEGPSTKAILTNAGHLGFNADLDRVSWSRNSFAANTLFHIPAIKTLPPQHTDIAQPGSLRPACRYWCGAINYVDNSPVCPASGRLPIEILLTIYAYLNVRDFNACRRTCRSWMTASLNKSLLIAMLHRGGWHGGSPAEHYGRTQGDLSPASSHEWILSRYLSRQCALAARWTGNGLVDRPALVESSMIDFSDLVDGYSLDKSRSSGALIFTSSICAKYLLVAKGTLIYVYQLEHGNIEPVSCVICPRRLLAMSMHAAEGRDAVAALLDGRMGMVCELRHNGPSMISPRGDMCTKGDNSLTRPKIRPRTPTSLNSSFQEATSAAEHTSPRVLRAIPNIRDIKLAGFNAIELKAQDHELQLQDVDDTMSHDRNIITQTWNLTLRGPQGGFRTAPEEKLPLQEIPIESGVCTFYRHLCSEDDPPRNVAICPQRRCVAFGCSVGIELHWIDALTGQSLSRWFPLTSPSDHLYFLSPRPGFESAKKLRLISSAAHPSDRSSISRRILRSATISSFRTSFGFESRSRQSRSYDHYHAIPLSDGHHILFVDPSTEKLAVGCDTPLGGPAKLRRKVVLQPPEGQGIPRVYTASADMSSGSFIVVVHDDTIMLYSIPPDLLALSRSEQAAQGTDIYNTPPFSSTGRHNDHWLNWWDEPRIGGPEMWFEGHRDSLIWPLSLHGTEIGRLPDVCELAIQTRPDILIWAFTYTSQCKTWRLHDFVDPVIYSKQYIDRNGLMHEACRADESRDVIMQDAPIPSIVSSGIHLEDDEQEPEKAAALSIGMAGIDGNMSGVLRKKPRALAVENDSWVDTVDVAGCMDAWFEGDGDIVTWSAS